MKKFLPYILLALVFITVGIINGTPFVFGDGYGYFHVAESIVHNDSYPPTQMPEYFSYTGHAVDLYNGKYVTVYSVGQTILWYPFLFVAKLIPHPSPLSGEGASTVYNDYYKAFNGHSIADGLAVLIAAMVFGYLTLVLIYKFLKDLGFSTKQSLVATTTTFLSSYLLAYIFQFPAYSHTYEVFAVSGLMYCIVHFGKKFEYRFMAYAGIFAGLLVLIRPVDALIVLPIFLYCLKYRNKKANLMFILAGIPFGIIYLLYNYVSFGSLIANPYSILGGGNFALSNFNLFKILFSDVRGWFIWSPLMLIAIIFLFKYARKTLPSILLYIAPVVFTIGSYVFWSNWWGGDSEGQRFFLVLLPFCALGVAAFLKEIRLFVFAQSDKLKLYRIGIALVIVCTLFSTITFVLYRITPVSKLYTESTYTNYPEIAQLAERYTVFDVYKYQFDLIKGSKSLSDYRNNLIQSFNGGRSLILLALGLTDPIVKVKIDAPNQFELNFIPNNNYSKIVADIDLSINYKGKVTNYRLKDVDFTGYHKADFVCEVKCVSDYPGTQSISKAGENYFKINSDLSVSLSSENNVKFVDYKLKTSY